MVCSDGYSFPELDNNIQLSVRDKAIRFIAEQDLKELDAQFFYNNR